MVEKGIKGDDIALSVLGEVNPRKDKKEKNFPEKEKFLFLFVMSSDRYIVQHLLPLSVHAINMPISSSAPII